VPRSDFGYVSWSNCRSRGRSAAAMGSGSYLAVSLLGLGPDETSEEPAGPERSKSARNRIYFPPGPSDLSGSGSGQSAAFEPKGQTRCKWNGNFPHTMGRRSETFQYTKQWFRFESSAHTAGRFASTASYGPTRPRFCAPPSSGQPRRYKFKIRKVFNTREDPISSRPPAVNLSGSFLLSSSGRHPQKPAEHPRALASLHTIRTDRQPPY
jgi:hypothetical protein